MLRHFYPGKVGEWSGAFLGKSWEGLCKTCEYLYCRLDGNVDFPFQLTVGGGGGVFAEGFKACNIGNFISAFRQPSVVKIMDCAIGLFQVAPDGKGGE